MVTSNIRAKRVFKVMTNNAHEAAFLISILANIIKVGTIIKPPPIPKSPLKIPTKTPNRINKKFKLDFRFIEFRFNKEKPDKKITTENKTIKKECFDKFKNTI